MSTRTEAITDLLARGLALTTLAGKRPTRAGWQAELPLDTTTLAEWAAHDNLGVRGGEASGRLVVIDVDPAHGGKTPTECTPTYCVATGGGGLHLYYRLPEGWAHGNGRGALAAGVDVRGDGGQVVAPGSIHPETGTVYTVADPQPIATIPQPLWAVITAPTPRPMPQATAPATRIDGELTPFDDFNLRGSWPDLLTRHGWQFVSEKGDRQHWSRPGKSPVGTSATLTVETGVFYVFSSAAAPFEAEQGYSLAGAYALLHHDGDHAVAATALRAQGYGGERALADQYPDIDISGILAQLAEPTPAPAPTPPPAPEPINGQWPDHLVPQSGFLAEFVEWATGTAKYPNRSFALGAGLAFAGWVLGHRVQTETGLRTNVYVFGVGPTGAGKDRPQRCIENLAAHVEAEHQVTGRPASAEGLEDALAIESRLLLLVDEAQDLVASASQGARDPAALRLSGMLCRVFSLANGRLTRRLRANRMGEAPPPAIEQPHVVLLGHATPAIWDSMTSATVASGLLPRCLVVENDPRVRTRRPCNPDAVPLAVRAFAEAWAMPREDDGNLSSMFPQAETVWFNDEAFDIIEDFADVADARHRAGDEAGAPEVCALSSRSAEHAARLALVYECCQLNGEVPAAIGADAARWAVDVMEWQYQLVLDRVHTHVVDSEQERVTQRVLAFIRTGRSGRSRSAALRKARVLSADFDKIITTLEARGEIAIVHTTTDAGRVRVTYQATRDDGDAS